MWAFHGVDLRIEGPVKDGKIYKRWSLPLSQAACSSLCDLWCLFPLPKGGRAKLLSTSRIFESHPKEKGEDPPPPPTPYLPCNKETWVQFCVAFTRLLCLAFCPFKLVCVCFFHHFEHHLIIECLCRLNQSTLCPKSDFFLSFFPRN